MMSILLLMYTPKKYVYTEKNKVIPIGMTLFNFAKLI